MLSDDVAISVRRRVGIYSFGPAGHVLLLAFAAFSGLFYGQRADWLNTRIDCNRWDGVLWRLKAFTYHG